jgi:hypothetical protein
MGAFIKKSTALKCPVHLAVVDKAQDALMGNGYFNKERILERTGMIAMQESIRWDYIADFIKAGIAIKKDDNGEQYADLTVDGCELVPLAQSFWNKKPKGDVPASTAITRMKFPEKYIAMGHGKKTAGYALVDFEDGVMALRQLDHKEAMSNGTAKAFKKYADALVRRNILEQKYTKKIEDKSGVGQ